MMPKYKVLFIPVNSIQAKICLSILNVLDNNFTYSVITVDSYLPTLYYRADTVFQQSGIPFKRVEQYGTRNPAKILEIERPDILVISQDVFEHIIRFFMRAARRKDIPVLCVQDAIFFGAVDLGGISTKTTWKKIKLATIYLSSLLNLLKHPHYSLAQKCQVARIRTRDIIQGRPNLWGHGESSKIAVMGDFQKNILISQGVDSEKIEVTGEPRWDELVKAGIEREEIFRELELDHCKKLVLLTTQPMVESGSWTPRDREVWLTNIVRAVNCFPECQLVIKPHPRDHLEPYQEILQRQSLPTLIVPPDFNTPKLLKACDLLLTNVCTTALEAMVVNKPVIIVDFKDDLHNVPYVSSSAALGIRHPEDLAPAIRRILYDQQSQEQLRVARQKFVYHHAYFQDGKASERVADLIKKMVFQSKQITS